MTGWSVTKTDKILGRLALSLDLVQQTAPVAAKRANCASVEADGLRRGRDGVGRSTETPDPTAAAALSRGERDEVAVLANLVPRAELVSSAREIALAMLFHQCGLVQRHEAQVERE